MEKINLQQLNDIGRKIGYPFYVFKDGSYGKKYVNGSMNTIMIVKGEFEAEILQEESFTKQVYQKNEMPRSTGPIIELAKKVTLESMKRAECGGRVHKDGHITDSKTFFYTEEISGYILWVNPEKGAPQGYRALCSVPEYHEMCMINTRFDTHLPEAIEGLADGYANTKEIYKAFRQRLIKTEAWEYIDNYAKNGLNQHDCFMMSYTELKVLSEANEKIIPLLGMWYGIGLFVTSSLGHDDFKGMQLNKDGFFSFGTLDIMKKVKVIPCFWI